MANSKKLKNEFEENEDLLLAEEDALIDESEFPIEESEEEIQRFTRKQKLVLIGIGILSFLTFTIALFPLEEILESILADATSGAGIIFKYEELDLAFPGEITLTKAELGIPNGPTLKGNKLEIIPTISAISNGNLDAEVLLDKGVISYGSENWIENLNGMNLSVVVDQIKNMSISNLTGSLNLSIISGKIPKLPEFPIVGDLGSITLKKSSVELTADRGMVRLKKVVLDSNVARIDITGSIRLQQPPSNSALDLRLCLQLDRNFAQERPDIQGYITLLEQQSGSKCIPVKGSFSQPQVEMNSLFPGAPGSQNGPMPSMNNGNALPQSAPKQNMPGNAMPEGQSIPKSP